MNSAYNDTTLSSFSSNLLNFSTEDEGAIVNISSGSHKSSDNGNLSSVLSQIQDDGPAYDEAPGRGNLFTRTQNSKGKISEDLANKPRKNVADNGSGEKLSSQGKPYKTNEGLTKASNNNAWFQIALILLITVITALTLFNINLRTSDLEQAINIHDTDLQDGGVSKNENILPEIDKINEVLKSVQQGMQLIKTDYSVLDKKYNETIENNISMKTGETVSIKDNVSVLESEIMALKEELYTVKGRLEIEMSTEKIKLEKKVVTRDGVIVNLASLTNEAKAKALVKDIHATGLLPEIQKAMVKDMQAFRISVGGFSDLEEAEMFIRSAGEQYGLKDGRVRKS